MLSSGQQAPDFTLSDQNNITHTLSDYNGSWVFLYFYPKDDTPGCTTEACSVRDNLNRLKSLGIEVLGVSTDSVKSHKKFETKYSLNFPLLADINKEVVTAYEVYGPKKFMGKEYEGILRTSFLISPEGKIAKVYEKVKPEGHVEEVISDFKNLQ